MDRYVKEVQDSIKEHKIIMSEQYLHPEEWGNRKINENFRSGTEDIKVIDKSVKELGGKVESLFNRTIARLDTVKDIITAEKERLQDITMLCNLKTDYDNAIPLKDVDFTGEFEYADGVFSAKCPSSSSIPSKIINVQGNGHEGNKYVLEEMHYLEDKLSTKNRNAITDGSITTYYEYSRITASNTEEFLISDFHSDGAEAQSTFTLKFAAKTNEIAIKSSLDNIKVTGIKYSDDNVIYKDIPMEPFIINNKDESYKNQGYIYGSNIISFPSSLYLKITFQSNGYLNENIAFERSMTTEGDKVKTITTVVPTAKRHVIRINDIKAKAKQYVRLSSMKSGNLISGEADVYAVSVFANMYFPEGTNKDHIEFNLTVNGIDYAIKPVNSYDNGIKIIRFSQGKMPTQYTKYIGEKITSVYLTVTIKTNSKISPYFNNLKLLLGGEV